MIVTHNVTMDLQEKSTVPQIDASQDDQYTRNLAITLLSGGEPWTVPADARVVVRYQKSDGMGGSYDTLPDGTPGCIIEENVLTLALAPQVLTVPGTVMLSATLIAGDQIISIFSVNMYVWPRVKEIFAESAPYYNVAGFLPGPVQAQVGQFLMVSGVDENGRVVEVSAAAMAAGGTGSGISGTEKNLMLTLFKNVPYLQNMSAAISSLEALWSGAGGDTGGEDSGGGTVTSYTITQNLTNVVSDNAASSIISGSGLTVNLTPENNAVLGAVTVTMGGTDITSTAYSAGKVSISSVTGDVVITATASAANHTQVEYIETSSAKESILTPYTLLPGDLVQMTWACLNTGHTYPLSGCDNGMCCTLRTRHGGDGGGWTFFTRRSGASFTAYNTGDETWHMPSAGTAVYTFQETVQGSGTISDESGTVLTTRTDANAASFAAPGCKIGLNGFYENGALRANTSMQGLRIYSFKITNAYGTAVLDMVPVLDFENVACMYDKVSDTYCYDINGKTSFIAGGAV